MGFAYMYSSISSKSHVIVLSETINILRKSHKTNILGMPQIFTTELHVCK